MTDSPRRIVILAEASLDFHHGKTATSLLRYRPKDIVAVIDSENAGQTTGAVLGLAGETPIVQDIREALQFRPTELLIGVAPTGGGLPDAWRSQILIAIENGVDIVSGLHHMLSEDEEFARCAAQHRSKLVDVRRPPAINAVAQLAPRRPGSTVVTFVGSDCAVGKMTAALETVAAARKSGLRAAFVATGQTGIMIEGSGIAIDRVIGDFMAGAVEQLVLDASESADWVFVEGQGSLLHPGYSGVTMSLLHGSAPDAMILVHPPNRQSIDEYGVSIPPLPDLIRVYEQAASWVRAAPVAAIALNTREMDEESARLAVKRAEKATGVTATDPVRFGADRLVEAVVSWRSSRTSEGK